MRGQLEDVRRSATGVKTEYSSQSRSTLHRLASVSLHRKKLELADVTALHNACARQPDVSQRTPHEDFDAAR